MEESGWRLFWWLVNFIQPAIVWMIVHILPWVLIIVGGIVALFVAISVVSVVFAGLVKLFKSDD